MVHVADLVVPDRESSESELTIRPQYFLPDRLVFVASTGDEDTGSSIAVALDSADVLRIRDALTGWLNTGWLNTAPAPDKLTGPGA